MQKNASDVPYTKKYGLSSSTSSKNPRKGCAKRSLLISGSDPLSRDWCPDRLICEV